MGHVNGDDDGVGYGVRGHGTINTTGVRGLTGNAVFDPDVDPANVGVFGKGGAMKVAMMALLVCLAKASSGPVYMAKAPGPWVYMAKATVALVSMGGAIPLLV